MSDSWISRCPLIDHFAGVNVRDRSISASQANLSCVCFVGDPLSVSNDDKHRYLSYTEYLRYRYPVTAIIKDITSVAANVDDHLVEFNG